MALRSDAPRWFQRLAGSPEAGQVLRSLQPEVGLQVFQVCPVERAPEHGGGLDPGGPAALDVVARVADEHGVGGAEQARVLGDGTDLNQTGSFYLAARPYVEANGAFISQVLTVLTQADALTRSDRAQSVTLLANAMGLPEPVIASYLDHRPPTAITPLDAHTIAAQQQTADLFYANRLVPVKVDISQRIWRPSAQ